MPNTVSKSIYVAGQRFLEIIGSLMRKCALRLVWTFEGSAQIERGLTVRSRAGEVIIGHGVTIGPYVVIGCSAGALLKIGANSSVNHGTVIEARQLVRIGRDVRIGEYCSIRDHDHEWRDPETPIVMQGYTCSAVVIGDDVWVGRGAVILKGVTIGAGAVVGASAVVTHDVPPFAVVAGVPARQIKTRE